MGETCRIRWSTGIGIPVFDWNWGPGGRAWQAMNRFKRMEATGCGHGLMSKTWSFVSVDFMIIFLLPNGFCGFHMASYMIYAEVPSGFPYFRHLHFCLTFPVRGVEREREREFFNNRQQLDHWSLWSTFFTIPMWSYVGIRYLGICIAIENNDGCPFGISISVDRSFITMDYGWLKTRTRKELLKRMLPRLHLTRCPRWARAGSEGTSGNWSQTDLFQHRFEAICWCKRKGWA